MVHHPLSTLRSLELLGNGLRTVALAVLIFHSLGRLGVLLVLAFKHSYFIFSLRSYLSRIDLGQIDGCFTSSHHTFHNSALYSFTRLYLLSKFSLVLITSNGSHHFGDQLGGHVGEQMVFGRKTFHKIHSRYLGKFFINLRTTI